MKVCLWVFVKLKDFLSYFWIKFKVLLFTSFCMNILIHILHIFSCDSISWNRYVGGWLGEWVGDDYWKFNEIHIRPNQLNIFSSWPAGVVIQLVCPSVYTIIKDMITTIDQGPMNIVPVLLPAALVHCTNQLICKIKWQ